MKPFERTYVEITNACNLSCPFCPGTARTPAFMSASTFDGILAALGGRCGHLYFHVLGEPLLHPDLGEMLAIAHRRRKRVNLTTNGFLIDAAGTALAHKPALRLVTFSLHSFPSGRGAGSVEAYLRPILDFSRGASARHLIRLRLWDGKDAQNDETRESMLSLIADAFDLPPVIRRELGCRPAVRLAENVFLNTARRFSWPDGDGPDFGDKGFCLALREQIAILVDGTVVPCCLDAGGAMPLGNVCSQPIEDILSSEGARRIHDGFSRRKVAENLCRHCSYRLRFGQGNRAEAPTEG